MPFNVNAVTHMLLGILFVNTAFVLYKEDTEEPSEEEEENEETPQVEDKKKETPKEEDEMPKF